MSLLTITNLTFREAWRKKLFWVALGLGVAFLTLFAIGFHYVLADILAHPPREARAGPGMKIFISQISGIFLILGLFAVNFLEVMMSALTSAGAIAGEISSHTIQTLVTKPIPRRHIVLGKWLGQSIMLVIYVIFMAGGLTLVIYFRTGYFPPNLAAGMGLLVLEGLIVLGIATFGGTFLPTMANGVLVFMLYGIAFAGSWVEQIGAALKSETAVQVGVIASLIMPSETMWRMASDLMQPRLIQEAAFPLISLYSKPSQAMIVYAVGYLLVFLTAAAYVFERRDL